MRHFLLSTHENQTGELTNQVACWREHLKDECRPPDCLLWSYSLPGGLSWQHCGKIHCRWPFALWQCFFHMKLRPVYVWKINDHSLSRMANLQFVSQEKKHEKKSLHSCNSFTSLFCVTVKFRIGSAEIHPSLKKLGTSCSNTLIFKKLYTIFLLKTLPLQGQ